MGDAQTIDEAMGLVRVWDATGQAHTFSFPKGIKDMTVGDLAAHLKSQSAWASFSDMLCFECETSKEKAELSPLDIKKKLPALKKKWGTNKADAYTRIVWMRAGDNYTPAGFSQTKNKDGRRSFKKLGKHDLSVQAPLPGTISPTSLSPTGLPPPPGQMSAGLPPPPGSSGSPLHSSAGLPLPPPPPTSTGLPPPPAPGSFQFPAPSNGSMPPPPPTGSNLPPPPPPAGGASVPLPPPPPPMGGSIPPPPPASSSSTPAKEKKGGWFSKRKSDKSDKDKKKVIKGGASTQDDVAADQILSELNAFHDPTGQYDYAGEAARPDFLISNEDLQNRYLNLNTSNANKIARSEHFQKILISWCNKHLAHRKLSISNLHSDLQNGVALINLLEILSGQEIKKYYKEPKHIPHQLENLEIVLKFLAVLGLPIKAECQDIYHGRLGIICGMLFMVIQKFKDGEDKQKKKKIDIKVEKIGAAEAALRIRAAEAAETAQSSAPPPSHDASSGLPPAPGSGLPPPPVGGLPPPPTSGLPGLPPPPAPAKSSQEFGGFDTNRFDASAVKSNKYATSLTPMAPVPAVGNAFADLPPPPASFTSRPPGGLPPPSSGLPAPPTGLPAPSTSGLPPPPFTNLPPPTGLPPPGGLPPMPGGPPPSARPGGPPPMPNALPPHLATRPGPSVSSPPAPVKRPGPPVGGPPPMPNVGRPGPPTPALPPAIVSLASIEADNEGELSLDALDDLDLDGDILDLENFAVNQSSLVDVDKHSLLQDLEGMKSFLDSMADAQDLTLDDLELDFDDILL